MNQLERLALDYAEAAINGVGRPYGHRYRKQLIRWWLAGFRGELAPRGCNYDRPLTNAWQDGAARRVVSDTVREVVDA